MVSPQANIRTATDQPKKICRPSLVRICWTRFPSHSLWKATVPTKTVSPPAGEDKRLPVRRFYEGVFIPVDRQKPRDLDHLAAACVIGVKGDDIVRLEIRRLVIVDCNQFVALDLSRHRVRLVIMPAAPEYAETAAPEGAQRQHGGEGEDQDDQQAVDRR